MELLRQGDAEGLERLVVTYPTAVRYLQGRLWDADPEIRSLAANTLGAAAAAHPELGRELLRRALWALNDESATNGGPMLPAVGEIGRRSPDLIAPFVGPFTSYLWDDRLRPGILDALWRIAEVAPELVAEIRDRLFEYENTNDPGERALIERLLSASGESMDGA